MRISSNYGVLLVGVAMLCAGPLLMRLAPDLPPQDLNAPWRMPEAISNEPAATPPAIRVGLTGLTPHETLILEWHGQTLLFQRFSHSVTAMNADLMPWFTQSWRGWTSVGSYASGVNDQIHVTRLERLSGTGGGVSARSYRVGPYTTGSLNAAKLLQIPAKIQGYSTVDVVLLNAECRRECDEVAEAAVVMLDRIMAANKRGPDQQLQHTLD